MTERLFDLDSMLSYFEATVLSSEKCENGYVTVLDKTAFFPEGGGQKGDTGFLGNEEVFDVQEKNGQIYHYSKNQIPLGKIKGNINFEKRFDKMQNHSGEHIISGIVNSLFGYDNVGFHLSENEMTMDFSGELSKEELEKIIFLANKAVMENRPIKAYYPKNASKIEYRSKKELEGEIRIVEIKGIDVCACCAPHVLTTGQIGAIVLTDARKFRGGMRLWVACGERAIVEIQKMSAALKHIGAALSVPYLQAAEGFDVFYKKSIEKDETITALKKEIVKKDIELLDKTKEQICYFCDDADSIKEAVNLLKVDFSTVCVLSGDDEKGYRFMSVGIKDEEDFKKSLCARGGGRDGMLQGSLTAKKADIIKYFS